MRFKDYPIKAILLATLVLGIARNPHVFSVRSGFSALPEAKLAALETPAGIGFSDRQQAVSRRYGCSVTASSERNNLGGKPV